MTAVPQPTLSLTAEDLAGFVIGEKVVSTYGLQRLNSRLKEEVYQAFNQILRGREGAQSIQKFNGKLYLKITGNNARDKSRQIAEAVHQIFSMPRTTERAIDRFEKEKQSLAPVISEGISVTSDLSSGVRNFLTVADRVHDMATKILGGVGGLTNLYIGANILKNGVAQGNQALACQDKGGVAEAILTGLMGLSIFVVGLGMFLLFPGIAAGAGLPIVMNSAFVLSLVLGVRSIYMLQYMKEFRNGLTAILESDKNDTEKMKEALKYLQEFTASREKVNKLIRRVGKEAALEIQRSVRMLIGGPESMEASKALIEQVMDANLQLISQQYLLLLIALLSFVCYLPGVSFLSKMSSARLVFVTNLLWLFVDQRHCKRFWEKMTLETHRLFGKCFQDPYFIQDREFTLGANDKHPLDSTPIKPSSQSHLRHFLIDDEGDDVGKDEEEQDTSLDISIDASYRARSQTEPPPIVLGPSPRRRQATA